MSNYNHVVKTIINHPQDHHRWGYKHVSVQTITHGVVYYCFNHNTLQYIAIHYIYTYTYINVYTWCIHVIIHQKASRVQVQLAGWRYPIPWLAGRPCISCIRGGYLCLLLTERYCNAICYVFYWLIQLLPMSLLLVTAHCCWYPPLATRSCHSYMWYMWLKDT